MKKLYICAIVVATAMIAGCSQPRDITSDTNLPKELADCKVFSVHYSAFKGAMQVVRCPNSTTTRVDVAKTSGQSVTLVNEAESGLLEVNGSFYKKIEYQDTITLNDEKYLKIR